MRIRAKHILAIVVVAIIAAAALFFSRPAAAPELRFAPLDGEALATSDLRGYATTGTSRQSRAWIPS
jgi:hypothetical protein